MGLFKLGPSGPSSQCPPGGVAGHTPPSNEYMQQLASLNTSVSQWIRKHVDSNPYVDLTPIFRDYTTHLRNIDAKVSRHRVVGGVVGGANAPNQRIINPLSPLARPHHQCSLRDGFG